MHTSNHVKASNRTEPVSGPKTGFLSAPVSLSERELINTAVSIVQPPAQSQGRIERTMDIVIAAAMVIVLIPLMILIALAIKIFSPGPVFFAHRRVGMNGQNFLCYKFRTMHVDAERQLHALLASSPRHRAEWNAYQKLTDDPRISSIGHGLRRSSLDELPQLFNVILGDMSLVGPRPIIEKELPHYGRFITSYFSVKPGLTGIWQVSGRNNTSYRRRVAADVLYSRSRSPALYLKILLLTVPAVLTGKGSR